MFNSRRLVVIRLVKILKHYDLFVLGAGSGGVRAARMSASLGAKVGIAEERYLGGTCVNVGCVPKKLFVYGSHFAEDFEDAQSYGWTADKPRFDWKTLRSNKDREISRLNGIYRNLLEGPGVEIYESHASFEDSHTIRLGAEKVTADKILVATGSWPHIPDIPGREHAVDSNAMFYLDELPQRAIVVGGGYIAVEFAGILAGLGVDTCLLYRGELFLRGFDHQIRTFVYEQMLEKGVYIRFNTSVVGIRANRKEKLVELSDGSELPTDLVLYATGRRPKTADCNLERAGVELTSNGAVQVDDDYRSNIEHIFAIGDVIDRAQLTPVAIAEGMCFTFNQFASEARKIDYDLIPTAIFCQPNIGTVGPIEEDAREKYPALQVFESSFRPMKHTMTLREEKTLMKILVDGDTDQVVAAHMVGPDAGELIQGIAVAITARATKSDFDRTIGIHPTAAEEFVTMREPVR